MPRATREKTKHPGVYKRETTHGTKYDVKIRNKFLCVGSNLEKAREERDRLIYEARFGRPFESKPKTLATFVAEDWLPDLQASVQQERRRSSTAYQYGQDVRGHILPALGDLTLQQIDIAAVERFSNKLTANGQSNFSVRRILNTLSAILEYARRHRIIQHNPVRDVEKPKARAKTKPILLTARELHALADCAPTKDEARLILTAAMTGARKAELFALRWPNIDVSDEGGALRIVEQYYRGQVVDRTKTDAGAREVPFGTTVAAILKEQAAEGRYSPHGLVFPSPEGHYWHASNFTRRVWATTRALAGASADLKFHHLRHFYVTMMRNQGLPTSVTEQLVGHTDDRTHRGYTQPTAAYVQVVREASDRAFEVAP